MKRISVRFDRFYRRNAVISFYEYRRGRVLRANAESSQKSIIRRVVFRARAIVRSGFGIRTVFPVSRKRSMHATCFARSARALVVTRLDNTIASNRDYRVILYGVHRLREQASYLLSREIALVVLSKVSNPVTPLSIQYCWPFDAEGTNPRSVIAVSRSLLHRMA